MMLTLKTIILFIVKILISHEGMHEKNPKWFLIMHGIIYFEKFIPMCICLWNRRKIEPYIKTQLGTHFPTAL